MVKYFCFLAHRIQCCRGRLFFRRGVSPVAITCRVILIINKYNFNGYSECCNSFCDI